MGGYSSDSDDYSRKSKKKRKKRSRSHSYSSSEESSKGRRSKHKKSKKSKHRRARSRSRGRRSRSRSKEKRSRSRGRRSRSRDRRSRSRDRRRGRYSRSRSRSYSRYRSRTRSRSRSRERNRRSRSRSRDRHLKSTEVDPCASVPGFKEMTPAQQTKIRMEMALKAAAAADEKLKEQGLLPAGTGRTAETPTVSVQAQQHRVKTIEDIESEGFAPTSFKSTRGQEASNKNQTAAHPMTDVNHEAAMFGFTSLPAPTKGIKYKETDNFLHPNLFVTADEKMEKWIRKLTDYRKQKLEGEAMK